MRPASEQPLFDFNQAVERISAAVEAARALPFPFTLTARTENYLRGNPDLDDTIRRLQAFEKAGADVLFAPAARSERGARRVLGAVAAGELHGRDQGQLVLGGGARRRPVSGASASPRRSIARP